MLVCRRVLEGLSGWLTNDGHEKVLSAVDMLKENLFNIKKEIDAMYWKGQLGEFLQLNIIESIEDLTTNIEEAYSRAYAASEEENNGDHLTASRNIHRCHEYINRTLANIVIQ